MLENELHKFNNSVTDLNMTTVKLDYIRKFNELMELTHSQDKKTIQKENLNQCLDYIKQNINDFNAIYKCNVKLGGRDTNNTLKILKKVYHQWSGMHLMSKDKKKNTAVTYVLHGDSFYDYLRKVHSHKDEILEAMNEHS